ncbi:MAG: hypothetical protein ABFD96_02450 [Armatimonadia bacterium]
MSIERIDSEMFGHYGKIIEICFTDLQAEYRSELGLDDWDNEDSSSACVQEAMEAARFAYAEGDYEGALLELEEASPLLDYVAGSESLLEEYNDMIDEITEILSARDWRKGDANYTDNRLAERLVRQCPASGL